MGSSLLTAARTLHTVTIEINCCDGMSSNKFKSLCYTTRSDHAGTRRVYLFLPAAAVYPLLCWPDRKPGESNSGSRTA